MTDDRDISLFTRLLHEHLQAAYAKDKQAMEHLEAVIELMKDRYPQGWILFNEMFGSPNHTALQEKGDRG